jgi:glucose/mannose-6-phosphate isomerase
MLGLSKNHEYTLEKLNTLLGRAIPTTVQRIIFIGMGSSASVSAILKGFFVAEQIPIAVEVVNDYALDYILGRTPPSDDCSLYVISSFSGGSPEPLLAYENLKGITSNIIFLTCGGELDAIGDREQVSCIHWRLKDCDREYPLFHAPQLFLILLDILHRLGILASNYQNEIKEALQSLEISAQKINEAEKLAICLRNRNIILLASAKWHESILPLLCMHFREIAFAPTHRSLIHEFTHSEIASCANPKVPQAVILFQDPGDSIQVVQAVSRIKLLLGQANSTSTTSVVHMCRGHFIEQFLHTLVFISHVTYHLATYYDLESRELISQGAGNPWYNRHYIDEESKNSANGIP